MNESREFPRSEDKQGFTSIRFIPKANILVIEDDSGSTWVNEQGNLFVNVTSKRSES